MPGQKRLARLLNCLLRMKDDVLRERRTRFEFTGRGGKVPRDHIEGMDPEMIALGTKPLPDGAAYRICVPGAP